MIYWYDQIDNINKKIKEELKVYSGAEKCNSLQADQSVCPEDHVLKAWSFRMGTFRRSNYKTIFQRSIKMTVNYKAYTVLPKEVS